MLLQFYYCWIHRLPRLSIASLIIILRTGVSTTISNLRSLSTCRVQGRTWHQTNLAVKSHANCGDYVNRQVTLGPQGRRPDTRKTLLAVLDEGRRPTIFQSVLIKVGRCETMEHAAWCP